MYYLNKNDQIFKISQITIIKMDLLTTMMPDTCTLNTRIAQFFLIKTLISFVVLVSNAVDDTKKTMFYQLFC